MTPSRVSTRSLQFVANAIHDRGRISNRFVLPEPQDTPPGRDQRLVGLDVAFPIALDLQIPVVTIDRRPMVVHWAPAPEAPVDEDRESYPSEHDVCSAPECGQRAEVDSVAEPARVQELSFQQLRRSVSTLVRLHTEPITVGRRP